MSANRISVSIPAEVVEEVLGHLNQIKTSLQPYVKSLTVEERKTLPKMSDKSFSFVSKTNEYSINNPEFCPSFLDVEELHKDFAAAAALRPVHELCQQIATNIDDTMLLAGSEAYTAGLIYYGSVQMAAKTGQANAKPIYNDLHQRFAGMGKKSKQDTPANGE